MPESAQDKAVIDCHQSLGSVGGRLRIHSVIHVVVESRITAVDSPLSAQTQSSYEAKSPVHWRESPGEQYLGPLTCVDGPWCPVVLCIARKIQDKTRTDP